MNVSFSLGPKLFPSAVVLLLLLFAGDLIAQQSFWNSSSQAKSVRRPHAAGTYIPTGNKTIYCWAGKDNMQIKVRQYHHGPETLGGTLTLAGTDVLPNHAPDYHDYPTIIRAADYRMLIFYCDHNHNLYMYRSKKDNSIWDGWDQVQISNAQPGYPMPVVADNGDLYVFFRIGGGAGAQQSALKPLAYIRSRDHGLSWEPAKVIIYFNLPDGMNNIYTGQIAHASAGNGYPERFLIGWTRAGFNANGSGGYDSRHRDLYFAYLNVADNGMYSASNQALGVVGNEDIDAVLVEDTGVPGNNQWVIGHTVLAEAAGDGSPVVLYDRRLSNGGSYVKFARFNAGGNRWISSGVQAAGGSRVGDLEYTGGNNFSIYLRRGSQLRMRSSTNGGQSWFYDGHLNTFGYSLQSAILIDGHKPGLQLFAHTHNNVGFAFADYTTGYSNYLFGE